MSAQVDYDARREAARRSNGEFGPHGRSAPEQQLAGSLSNESPADIDGQLADIYERRGKVLAKLSWPKGEIRRAEENIRRWTARPETYHGDVSVGIARAEASIAENEASMEAIHAEADAISDEAAPFELEYQRRGGWPRAFLTRSSTNPHVHLSMDCSTCNREGKATKFAWMTEFSGMSEEELVEQAGERACTTCFPSAPVESLGRPTRMFSEDEKRKARERDERAAAKAERDAKKIANALTPDGSEFAVQSEPGDPTVWRNRASFKTERTAVTWAVDNIGYARALGHQEDRQRVRLAAVRQIAEAVAVKHDRDVEHVMAEFTVKADLKDGRITRAEAKAKLAELDG